MAININTQIKEIEIIITIIEIRTLVTLNGHKRYILKILIVDFMNLKVNKYQKIGLKLMNHKEIFPNIHKSHKIIKI
jgi:hypothetical protein